jgi:hypothetical protein
MTRKKKPRVDTYAVISRAVEEGVATGIRRAIKYAHGDDGRLLESYSASLSDKLYNEVMNALSDVLIYEEVHGENDGK